MRKGIILAGGLGTRLYPMTVVTNKQLLPIYDKPLIYYPLGVLMLAGIKDILLISSPSEIPNFKKLLGDGSQFGIRLEYEVQHEPRGIAEQLIIGEKFIGDNPVALILGDNIFYGHGLTQLLKEQNNDVDNATVFAYYVEDPERFGVIELDENGNPISIEEKPKYPKSNYAVVGLYFYPSGVSKLAKTLKPSWRNELEITDLNKLYLELGKLSVKVMGRGFAWFDTGTPDSLLDQSEFVKVIQKRQNIVLYQLEEIAYRNGWITKEQLLERANQFKQSRYGQYLINIATENILYNRR